MQYAYRHNSNFVNGRHLKFRRIAFLKLVPKSVLINFVTSQNLSRVFATFKLTKKWGLYDVYLYRWFWQIELSSQFAPSRPRHVVFFEEFLFQPGKLFSCKSCPISSYIRIRRWRWWSQRGWVLFKPRTRAV